MVARYGACLTELSARQRRVLRLRAGVGPRQPASRAVVARRLDLPVARVRRAEQRGLQALRRSARDGCGSASDGAGADPGTATGPAGASPLGASIVLTGEGSGGDDPASAQGGDSGGGGRDAAGGGSSDGRSSGDGSSGNGGASGGVKGVSATRSGPASAATDVTLPLLALVLIGLTALGVRAVRRSRAA